MAEKKDYYGILGLTKEATEEDIKKSYRKLAMQYHPDRWANGTEEEKKNAESKFKEIAEAYEILSDPQKRQQYDNGGMDFDMGGFDPMDIFARMQNQFGGFGGFGPFFNMGGNRQRVKRGSDIEAEITLTLEEAYRGGDYTINIQKNKPCPHCNGTGSEDGQDSTCPDCHGKGMIQHMQQMGPGSFSMTSSPCPKCHGTGKIISTPCKHCHGTGLETEYTSEIYNLPAGLSNNMIVRVPGAGNAPAGGGVNGDLQIIVHVKNDPYYYRPDDINLIHYEEVPFNEALLGFKKEFKCIDGSTVTVNAPELTPHGKSFIFKGKGMPNPNNPRQIGDYAVVINHKLPHHLSSKQKDALKHFDD